jgi:hypothetical protein
VGFTRFVVLAGESSAEAVGIATPGAGITLRGGCCPEGAADGNFPGLTTCPCARTTPATTMTEAAIIARAGVTRSSVQTEGSLSFDVITVNMA